MKVTEETISLIKKGVSINKICQLTGLAKSTIYHHYKKILGKKTKPIVINFKNEGELGEFLGIFAGDGHFHLGEGHHYVIRISVGHYEKGYRHYLQKELPIWFNKRPYIYCSMYKGKPSCIALTYYSKEIYSLVRNYLAWESKKTYTVRLKNLEIKKEEFNLGFLRGLIDTDGSFYAPKRRISFSTVSKKLSEQVIQIILHNCKLVPNVTIYRKKGRADLHTITLHGKNAKRLIALVKPSNPNKRGSGVVW